LLFFSVLLNAQIKIKERVEIKPTNLKQSKLATSSTLDPGTLLIDSDVQGFLVNRRLIYYFEVNGVSFGSTAPVERLSQLLPVETIFDLGRFPAGTIIIPRISQITSYSTGLTDGDLILAQETADITFRVTGFPNCEPVGLIYLIVQELLHHINGTFSKSEIGAGEVATLSLVPVGTDGGTVGILDDVGIAINVDAEIQLLDPDNIDGSTYIYRWGKAKNGIQIIGNVIYGSGESYDGTVSIWCPYTTDSTTSAEILVQAVCPEVKLSKDTINPGDTVAITIIGHKPDGTVPYPPDQKFIVSMDADAQYGKLYCTVDSGTSITGTQPFEFIAADSIDVDSMVIHISASPVSNGGGGGGGNAGSIKDGQKKDTLQRQAVLEKKITPSQKGAVPIEDDTKNALTVIQAAVAKKLAKQNNVIAQKAAKKQALMNAITEAMKTLKAGKGDAVSAKQLNAMIQELAEGDQCQLFATLTIENEDDKCPCISEPVLPKTSVAIKASGEILGETLSCLPKANGKLPLAEFRPVLNSAKAFEYDLNSISLCCDQNSENWVFQIPPITFNSVIGLCENNLQNITDLATLNVSTLSSTDRCVLKAQLNNGQNTMFKTQDGRQYYLKDATLTHEDVHRVDYEKNIADAAMKVYNEVPYYFKISKSQYKTATEALERAKDNLKQICGFILSYANDFRDEQIGKDNPAEQEKYESYTQENNRVQNIYTNFIKTRLSDPSCIECNYKYGVQMPCE